VPRARAYRRPIAVIIDNLYPDARPQSGLSHASLVFEAPVEGGVTRLMAMYEETDAHTVGPVRSARPYFVSWAAGFQAALVHAGGSPGALQRIRRTPQIVNIDALRRPRGFNRTADRIAPHNLYAHLPRLRALFGLTAPGSVVELRHKLDAGISSRGAGLGIKIDFSLPSIASGPAYQVAYHYDPARNAYLRFVGGDAAIDQVTGQQLEPKNVAVLTTAVVPIAGDPAGRLSVYAVGHGPALYLQDGRIIHGRWRKKAVGNPIQFWDNSGRPFAFNRGQTWIEVVPPGAVRTGRR
jgi:hypothetical protein